MLSSKRCAQLGLGAASFVLVASVAVLLAGAADAPAAGDQAGHHVRVAPLAESQITAVPTQAVTPSAALPRP